MAQNIEITQNNMPDVFWEGHTVVKIKKTIWIEKQLTTQEIQSIAHGPYREIIKKKDGGWRWLENVSHVAEGLYRYLYWTEEEGFSADD